MPDAPALKGEHFDSHLELTERQIFVHELFENQRWDAKKKDFVPCSASEMDGDPTTFTNRVHQPDWAGGVYAAGNHCDKAYAPGWEWVDKEWIVDKAHSPALIEMKDDEGWLYALDFETLRSNLRSGVSIGEYRSERKKIRDFATNQRRLKWGGGGGASSASESDDNEEARGAATRSDDEDQPVPVRWRRKVRRRRRIDAAAAAKSAGRKTIAAKVAAEEQKHTIDFTASLPGHRGILTREMRIPAGEPAGEPADAVPETSVACEGWLMRRKRKDWQQDWAVLVRGKAFGQGTLLLMDTPDSRVVSKVIQPESRSTREVLHCNDAPDLPPELYNSMSDDQIKSCFGLGSKAAGEGQLVKALSASDARRWRSALEDLESDEFKPGTLTIQVREVTGLALREGRPATHVDLEVCLPSGVRTNATKSAHPEKQEAAAAADVEAGLVPPAEPTEDVVFSRKEDE